MLELSRRSEMADYRSGSDLLSVTHPQLPADALRAQAKRGPPRLELNRQSGHQTRIYICHEPKVVPAASTGGWDSGRDVRSSRLLPLPSETAEKVQRAGTADAF